MQEISRLVSGYDKRIALEADKLFEKFGLDNGDKILKNIFQMLREEIIKIRSVSYTHLDVYKRQLIWNIVLF